METLDLKNTLSKIKHLLDGLSFKMKRAGEKVNKPEDKSVTTGHSEEQKEDLNFFKTGTEVQGPVGQYQKI